MLVAVRDVPLIFWTSGLLQEPAYGSQHAILLCAQACVAHEVIDGPRFTAALVGGVSFSEALARWFYRDASIQVRPRCPECFVPCTALQITTALYALPNDSLARIHGPDVAGCRPHHCHSHAVGWLLTQLQLLCRRLTSTRAHGRMHTVLRSTVASRDSTGSHETGSVKSDMKRKEVGHAPRRG